VNVYVRRPGAVAGAEGWRLLGRDNRPPFDDPTPPAEPGAPEAREYRILAVYNDQEVGQPSDIASVVVTA
jgi:hypothetical protein